MQLISPCGGGSSALPIYDAHALGGSFSGGTVVIATATPRLLSIGSFSTSDPTGLVFDTRSYTSGGQTVDTLTLEDALFTYVYHVQVRVFWPAFAGYRSLSLGVSNPSANGGFDLPSKVYGSDSTDDAVQTVTMIFRAYDGAHPQSVLATLEQRSGVNQTMFQGSPSFSPLVIAQAIPDTL